MKEQSLLVLIIVTLFAAVLLCVGRSKSDAGAQSTPETQQRRFAMTGRVVTADLQFRKVTIAHDNIPDYMEAMTMPFTLQDEAMLRALKQGDQIRAMLVIDLRTNLAWLETFEVTATNSSGAPAATIHTNSHH